MTFNSFEYALFLPAVVAAHWLIAPRWRQLLLLIASYVFYAAWDWRFLSLLVISTVTDFLVGLGLEKTDSRRARRRLLSTSVVVNLSILATFKYLDFFVAEATRLLRAVGFEAHPPALRLVLPVGISFYTFQTMSYSIDVYRRRVPACRNPLLFANFVAFFPQLVAGPIERASRLVPQLEDRERRPDLDACVSGCLLVLRGLVRKVVIADQMAPIVADVFDTGADKGTLAAAVGLLAFALQIYGDFAGYTDIARGSARLLGVELTPNFRRPYFAASLQEFWRRWHISLSNWLRDYLYIPLGGNRRGPRRRALNVMVTMTLGGLWHGAAVTFLAWGALHGAALVVERALSDMHASSRRATRHLRSRVRAARSGRTLLTFGFVTVAWVFFRASSPSAALDVLSSLAEPSLVGMPGDHLVLFAAAVAGTLCIDVLEARLAAPAELVRRRPLVTGAAVGAALVSLLIASVSPPSQFIYFQF